MKHYNKIVLLISFCLLTFAVNAQQASSAAHGNLNTDSLKVEMAKQKKAIAAQFAKTQVTSMVTKNKNGTYGYFIFADGQLLIEQKNIPAIAGNNGFINEAEAHKTAELAIGKLKEGEMPPTITVEELKALKITGVNY